MERDEEMERNAEICLSLNNYIIIVACNAYQIVFLLLVALKCVILLVL